MSLPKLNNENKDNKDSSQPVGLPSFSMPPLEDTGLPQLGGLPEVENDYQEDDGDGFEDVAIGEVLDDDDDNYLNEEIYQEVKDVEDEDEQELPIMDYGNSEDYFADEEDYNPDYEEDVKNGKKKKFIDKKRKKLIPFGGKKSKRPKRSVKSSDFDERKNVLAKTKVVRFIVMLTITALFLFGLKNTFFPSHVYTDDQIRAFAKEGAGQTEFPRERGEAFVENFMESYLTFDRSKQELNEILEHFYGGSLITNKNMEVGNEAKQHIIIGPNIYDVEMLSDSSALFKVTAYVSNSTGEELLGRSANGRWLSFAVNVYYNKDLDAMAITKDSPSIIPPYRIIGQTQVPERAPFGNGIINKEIAPAINPTINGFVEAFANASISSHESILQYITDKDNIALVDGFGGSVELNGPASEAIQRVIYENDDGVYRVDLTVNWIDNVASGGNNRVEYTSRYVMRVNPEGEGKYSVSSFVPYTYFEE